MDIWLNGRLVPDATLDALSAGTTLGWGVFTTVGIAGGAPRLLRRHFERLQRDAALTQIAFEMDFDAVAEGMNAVLESNGIQDGLGRLTLTQRGDGRWNMQNGSDLTIAAVETKTLIAPLRVQLSPYRVEARRALAGVKTTSYLPYLWAWREAKSYGFDEAILRDGADFLSEGARTNLFWVKNNTLYTPALSTGCLRGLGRELVLAWGQARALPTGEGQFSSDELQTADEVWLISAATGPRPVASWHDEEGALLGEFEGEGKLRADLSNWWEELGRQEAI